MAPPTGKTEGSASRDSLYKSGVIIFPRGGGHTPTLCSFIGRKLTQTTNKGRDHSSWAGIDPQVQERQYFVWKTSTTIEGEVQTGTPK